MAVYPTNDPNSVDYIGKRLGVDLDQVFALENVDGKLHLYLQGVGYNL